VDRDEDAQEAAVAPCCHDGGRCRRRLPRRQVKRCRQEHEAAQDAAIEEQAQASAAAPAPAAAGLTQDAIAKLQQLGQLHEQGILTDEEFASQKQEILNG
jgi:hypothetical protein